MWTSVCSHFTFLYLNLLDTVSWEGWLLCDISLPCSFVCSTSGIQGDCQVSGGVEKTCQIYESSDWSSYAGLMLSKHIQHCNNRHSFLLDSGNKVRRKGGLHFESSKTNTVCTCVMVRKWCASRRHSASPGLSWAPAWMSPTHRKQNQLHDIFHCECSNSSLETVSTRLF